jgi:hypothetical protein
MFGETGSGNSKSDSDNSMIIECDTRPVKSSRFSSSKKRVQLSVDFSCLASSFYVKFW